MTKAQRSPPPHRRSRGAEGTAHSWQLPAPRAAQPHHRTAPFPRAGKAPRAAASAAHPPSLPPSRRRGPPPPSGGFPPGRRLPPLQTLRVWPLAAGRRHILPGRVAPTGGEPAAAKQRRRPRGPGGGAGSSRAWLTPVAPPRRPPSWAQDGGGRRGSCWKPDLGAFRVVGSGLGLRCCLQLHLTAHYSVFEGTVLQIILQELKITCAPLPVLHRTCYEWCQFALYWFLVVYPWGRELGSL